MKNFLLVYCLLISLVISAQSKELFTNDWYLTQLSIGGTDYFTPPSDTSAMPPFTDTISLNYPTEITSGMIVTYGCNSFDIGLSNLNDEQFDVEFVGTTLMDCMYPNYSMYDDLYFEFYRNSQFDIPIEGFNYTIIENSDETKALIVTNPSGDVAYYLNAKLAIHETGFKNDFQLAITQGDLIIKGITPSKVEVYNTQGKLIIEKHNVFHSININHLNKGIYIVKLKESNGKVYTRKFIK